MMCVCVCVRTHSKLRKGGGVVARLADCMMLADCMICRASARCRALSVVLAHVFQEALVDARVAMRPFESQCQSRG